MRPTIADPDSPLTAEMLARAEERLGFRLPDNYVAFLRENNGGRPTPDTVPTPSFPGSAATDLRRFYGIEARSASYDLVSAYEMWIRDSPANLLPIACDSGGSEFCLSIYGDDAGKVYYWDWYREAHHVQTRYPWIYPVADSFEEFLDGFRELTAEELGPVEENEFVWRTDWMTAEILRDDEFLDIGQYLDVTQHLPPGETGWTGKKLNIPESWSVRSVEVADGTVTIKTADGRHFRLTRDNVGELDASLLNAQADEEVERLWIKHAQVDSKWRGGR